MIPLVILGAGPVGLFLACLLAREGRAVTLIEGRTEGGRAPGPEHATVERPRASARSIGIHPPALEALDGLQLAEPLVHCGVAIRRAHVFDEGRHLGTLSLDRCPPPFRFVLSVPQGTTESALVARLEELAPGAVRYGFEVAEVRERQGGVELRSTEGERLETRFLVGCDGHRSLARRALARGSGRVPGGTDHLMADLPDSSDLGHDAAIFLGGSGVVESFPLPGARRRWVARLEARPHRADLETLRELVEERTGHWLAAGEGDRATLFGARNSLAGRFAGRSWALAGDAAHVMSPIGGQGMNLGLLGAGVLVDAGVGGGEWRPERYERVQRRRARRAARRANVNMALGGTGLPTAVRRAAVRLLLSRSTAPWAAGFFTMRGL